MTIGLVVFVPRTLTTSASDVSARRSLTWPGGHQEQLGDDRLDGNHLLNSHSPVDGSSSMSLCSEVMSLSSSPLLLGVTAKLITGVAVNKPALKKAFTPEVFAADEALRLVAEGMSFRDAYDHVKNNLSELGEKSPSEAIAAKTHLGAPAGLDLAMLSNRARTATAFCREERKIYSRAVSRLLTA